MAFQAPLHRLRITEDLLEFFQTAPLGLHNKPPHQRQLDEMEHQEDGVRPPANIFQRDGRRVGVDETSHPGHEALERHALGADVVVQHLGRVQRLQRCPGETPHDAVEEDHRDERVPRARADVPVGFGRDHVDRDVDHPREEGAPEEQGSAAERVDGEGPRDAAEEGEDGVQRVEQELLRAPCDADVFQDHGHVVADHGAADELREHRDEHDQPDPVQRRPGVEEKAVVVPAPGEQLGLEVDAQLDLVALELDDGGVGIVVAVVLGQDGAGLVRLGRRVQVSRGLGDGVDQSDDDEGGDRLDDDRDAPGPVRGHVAGAVGGPGRRQRPDVVADDVVQAAEETAPAGEGHFDEVDGRGRHGDGDAQADEEPPALELSQIARFWCGLDDGPEDDEAGADKHAEASAENVAGRAGEEGSDDVADGVDGEHQTDAGALHADVEEGVESGHGVQGAHDGAVEAVHAVV